MPEDINSPPNIKVKPANVEIKPEKSIEDMEERKARLDNLWSNWEQMENNSILVSLFDRKQEFSAEQDPNKILEDNDYPERTSISELQFDKWKTSLDPKFVKDGYIYLLRGDHPNQGKKGFYSRSFGYGKLSTKQLTKRLEHPDEVGYYLYGDERYLTTAKASSKEIAEQLAMLQSQKGGSSFISTTTNIPCAESGTGNQPDAAEQLKYEIYVLKIPVDAVINSNTGNYYGMEENEYLVPDFVSKDEIVAIYSRDQREDVYQYLNEKLGVSREDVGLK